MATSSTRKKTVTVKKTPAKPKVVAKKLPPNPFIHEILDLVSSKRTIDQKVSALQEYRTDALTAVLIWNFDDSVISLLPEGEVPYQRNEVPVGTDHTSLRHEWKNLYHFIKGGNDSLSKTRRETMFIQMLEGLHPEEADLICIIKDKGLSNKYKISKQAVEKAFPDIRWGDRS